MGLGTTPEMDMRMGTRKELGTSLGTEMEDRNGDGHHP